MPLLKLLIRTIAYVGHKSIYLNVISKLNKYVNVNTSVSSIELVDKNKNGDARSTDVHEGGQLTLGELLGAEPHEGPPEASRLPLRS